MNPTFDEVTKRRLGRLLARTVTEYLRDPEHRRAFEAWYLKQYGVPYEWKRVVPRDTPRPEESRDEKEGGYHEQSANL